MMMTQVAMVPTAETTALAYGARVRSPNALGEELHALTVERVHSHRHLPTTGKDRGPLPVQAIPPSSIPAAYWPATCP